MVGPPAELPGLHPRLEPSCLYATAAESSQSSHPPKRSAPDAVAPLPAGVSGSGARAVGHHHADADCATKRRRSVESTSAVAPVSVASVNAVAGLLALRTKDAAGTMALGVLGTGTGSPGQQTTPGPGDDRMFNPATRRGPARSGTADATARADAGEHPGTIIREPAAELPLTISDASDHQLAFGDLKKLMAMMRGAGWPEAKIQAAKIRRRKLKNRTSAKGSTIRKRHEFGNLAEENKQLADTFGSLLQKITVLEAAVATGKAREAADAHSYAELEAENVSLRSEVDALRKRDASSQA